MKKIGWLILGISLLLSGCSGDSAIHLLHAKQDEKELETLRFVLEDEEKMNESVGVFFDHQLVVAVQVHPLSKFRKEKIEKRITDLLKKKFPDHDVFVSSDLKIMWELKDLVEQKPTDEKLKKTLKDIQSLAKEET
ncbi:MAG: hypothetical protein ABWX61_08455 [Paenisporosarcina sp.]